MTRCKLQIRREPDIAGVSGRLTIAIDNRTVFDLEAGDSKSVMCEPGDVTINVRDAEGSGFSRRMSLPENHLLFLSLHGVKPVLWRKLLGISRTLDFTEISRIDLGADESGKASS